MPASDDMRFLGLATRLRKAQKAKQLEEAANKAALAQQAVPTLRVQEMDDARYESGDQSDTKLVNLDYLFDESGIRVTPATIEFGKFTYVLKHLASTKRTDRVPSRSHYQAGMAITLFSVLVVIIYIFTGQITFGLGAVIYLLLSLSAFCVSVILYLQIKPSYTLVFKDASGGVIQSVTRHDKGLIVRLEKAIKLALSGIN